MDYGSLLQRNKRVSNFVLGNAQSNKDYPIVYCSDGFCALTGFSRSELMTKSCSCNFLYGMDTDREQCQKIRSALHSQVELKAEILFYKRNGSPFWCLLDILPIKNEKGDVVLFLVSHKDITKSRVDEFDTEESTSTGRAGNGMPPGDPPAPKFRKFSRDVLFHLQRQYQGVRSPPSRAKKFTAGTHASISGASFLPQYKLENTKLPKYMFLHFGRARLVWDWVILILVAYIAVMIPFNVAFKAHDRYADLIVADVVLEILFIVDICINFRTTYIDKKSGRIVTQQKKIALHYLKGWFIVDFLPALPFEALYFINQSWGFLVAFLKTGRLLRLFRVARRINRYTEYTAALLGLLMFSFALLAHWFACIWFVIGYQELKDGVTVGWLHELGPQMGYNQSLPDGPSYGEAYVSSFYFILTSLTTVGFGNIAPDTPGEKIFSVIVLLLGAMMQSAIFGNMTAVIQKLYAVRARFHARATEVKQFVKLHRIEGDLRRRIEDFFLTHWSVSKGVDTNEMLDSFPVELRADICLHLYRNFLTLNCFETASRGCLRAFSLKVRRAYFGPGELILKESDAINCVFFVNSGSIEIVQKECIVAILGSGDLFGEDISKKSPINRSNGDVRALTYCDLLYLTRDHFHEVLYFYPDFAEQFGHRLEMTFNLGQKEREMSLIYGNLDSITEDDEEAEVEEEEYCEDTSSDSDDENNEDSSLINASSSRGYSGLPLWQRKLRKMETSPEGAFGKNSVDSLALEKKLQQIESSSETDICDDDTRNSVTDCDRYFDSSPLINEINSDNTNSSTYGKTSVNEELHLLEGSSHSLNSRRGDSTKSSKEKLIGLNKECSNTSVNFLSEAPILRAPANSQRSMTSLNSVNNEETPSSTGRTRTARRRGMAPPPTEVPSALSAFPGNCSLPKDLILRSCPLIQLEDGKGRSRENLLKSAPQDINRSNSSSDVNESSNYDDKVNTDNSRYSSTTSFDNVRMPCLSQHEDFDKDVEENQSLSSHSIKLDGKESLSDIELKYSLSPINLIASKDPESASYDASLTSLNLPTEQFYFESLSDSLSRELSWDTFHCNNNSLSEEDQGPTTSIPNFCEQLNFALEKFQSKHVNNVESDSRNESKRPVSTHFSDSGASFSENRVGPRRSNTFHVHEKERKFSSCQTKRRRSASALLESKQFDSKPKVNSEPLNVLTSPSSLISLSPTTTSEINSDLMQNVKRTVEEIGKSISFSEDGNCYVHVSSMVQHMSESKEKLVTIVNHFEKLNNDVNVLRDDVQSLTNLVRALIQQKSAS